MVFARFVSNFDLRFEPAAICFYLRYSVSYTCIKLRQIFTYENDFMKIEIYIGLNSELGVNKHFKNVLTNYTKSDILTKRFVLLPVDWDKNGLLHIYEAAPYNEYHYCLFIARPIMNNI